MNQSMPKPMYSPRQVGAATFFGGPLAGGHLLYSNFMALDKSDRARLTAALSSGLFIILLLAGALLHVKSDSASVLIAVVLALIAEQLTKNWQLKKAAIADSTDYVFQSNWKVFGVIVTWMILTLLIIFAVALLLSLAGARLQN